MIIRFIGKLLVTALAAIIAAYFLPGVKVAGGFTPLLLAVVLALLNSFVKPVLVFLTIPISILTLGLFLLIINMVIIMIAAHFVSGFSVNGWLNALWFSLLLSFVTYIIELVIGMVKK